MKSFTTIPRWSGLEQSDLQPLRQQIRHLLWAYRWRWLGWSISRFIRLAIRIIAFPIPFLLLVYCGPLLRWFDPSAAVIDIGAVSLLILAVVALAVFLAASRWLIGLLFPVLRSYQKRFFSNNFKSLSPWQKITFYLVIFFGLLYAFVVCLVAVF